MKEPRIFKLFANYDESLTIAQLKKAILNDEALKTEQEDRELKELVNNIEGNYFKCYLNREIEIHYFGTFVEMEVGVDGTKYFNFNVNTIYIKEDSIRLTTCTNCFSQDRLSKLIRITQAEYRDYLDKYYKITSKLKDLCRQY